MKTEINFGQESVIGEVTRINRIKGEDGFDVYIDVSETNKLNIGMSVTNSIRIFEEEALSVNKNALIEDNGFMLPFLKLTIVTLPSISLLLLVFRMM